MAPAITANTVAPATRESRKFFNEGVTAASAARGEAKAAAVAETTAACKLVALLTCCELALTTQALRATARTTPALRV